MLLFVTVYRCGDFSPDKRRSTEAVYARSRHLADLLVTIRGAWTDDAPLGECSDAGSY